MILYMKYVVIIFLKIFIRRLGVGEGGGVFWGEKNMVEKMKCG